MFNRWKLLISGFNNKIKTLSSVRDKFRDLEDKCELLEMLLSQVDVTLQEITPDSTSSQSKFEALEDQVTVF